MTRNIEWEIKRMIQSKNPYRIRKAKKRVEKKKKNNKENQKKKGKKKRYEMMKEKE